MMLLLDTCVLIWIAQDRSQLSDTAQAQLSAGGVEPIVSAISAFEVALKWRKGKLKLSVEPARWFEQVTQEYRLRVEPITFEDALRSVLLPVHHNDPADRMIVATAVRLSATILTPDLSIRQYSEAVSTW